MKAGQHSSRLRMYPVIDEEEQSTSFGNSRISYSQKPPLAISKKVMFKFDGKKSSASTNARKAKRSQRGSDRSSNIDFPKKFSPYKRNSSSPSLIGRRKDSRSISKSSNQMISSDGEMSVKSNPYLDKLKKVMRYEKQKSYSVKNVLIKKNRGFLKRIL